MGKIGSFLTSIFWSALRALILLHGANYYVLRRALRAAFNTRGFAPGPQYIMGLTAHNTCKESKQSAITWSFLIYWGLCPQTPNIWLRQN